MIIDKTKHMRCQYGFQDVVKFCSKLSGWVHVVVFDARNRPKSCCSLFLIIAAVSEAWLRVGGSGIS